MKRFFSLLLLILMANMLSAENFRFIYTTGDKYRILSTVNEDVYLNKELSHKAEILNRITVDVTEGGKDGGYHSCTFQTSEEAKSAYNVFSWGKTYDSEFFRDAFGRYDIGDQYFMPIVRNVPVFPDQDLVPGSTWKAAGEEVHDFTAAFGIEEAVRFPVDVTYRYIGIETWKGEKYHTFSIAYNVHHEPQFKKRPAAGTMYPVLIAGQSRQKLFWDASRGRPQAYQEEFNFLFELSTGDSVEYKGTAEAEIIESKSMDKETIVEDIKQALDELGVANTDVRSDELGVTLSVENIQFLPDSSTLVAAEKEKLDRIGEILEKYADRDILISGHTALAGSREGRQKLSEDRAAAVGSYLIQKGVRTKDRMIFRGMGADVPLADNSTEAGKAKNRRVEITLLEN